MKKIALSLIAALISSSAFAAPPAGSCLGGCLSTAIAAPTPIIPVGYECKTGWPFQIGHASCVEAAVKSSQFGLTDASYTNSAGHEIGKSKRP